MAINNTPSVNIINHFSGLMFSITGWLCPARYQKLLQPSANA
jgi:hypothetical protein